jgi:hypothetical protein
MTRRSGRSEDPGMMGSMPMTYMVNGKQYINPLHSYGSPCKEGVVTGGFR